jgi:hypothetical protein
MDRDGQIAHLLINPNRAYGFHMRGDIKKFSSQQTELLSTYEKWKLLFESHSSLVVPSYCSELVSLMSNICYLKL